MEVKFKDLTLEEQKFVKSALNSNGLKVKDVTIYRDVNNIAIEINSTGQLVKLNF